MGKFNDLIRLPEFERDLKHLLKRFRSLEDDLRVFIDTQLVLFHKLEQDNGGIFRIPSLCADYPLVFKARKFACRSLKGTGSRSGIRVIYAYEAENDRIVLIEIYLKSEQENEDKSRINAYLKAPTKGGR